MRRRPLLLAVLTGGLAGRAAAAEPNPTLALNAAGRADLESLPGIGPALAERLLAARAADGPFRDWDDLRRRIRGLGTARLRQRSQAGLRVQGQPFDAGEPGAAAPPG